MFERYTEQARRAIYFARREAFIRGSDAISPAHLVLGLSIDEDSRANQVAALKDKLCSGLARLLVMPFHPCRAITNSASAEIPLTDDSKKVLAFAAMESGRVCRLSIDTDDLLCGILRFRNAASIALNSAGISLSHARKLSKRLRANEPPETGILRQFGMEVLGALKQALVSLAVIATVGLIVVLIVRLLG
jgi:ATP-dependent Clp protease ATP-binding subunit ClpC